MTQQPQKQARTAKPMSAIDALAKLQRILNQLNDSERKRVLAFLAAQ